jgi:hypothetical protein
VVTWRSTVAAADDLSLEWAVRTAEASGSYAIAVEVKQMYGAAVIPLGTYNIAIEVRGLDSQLAGAIAALQAAAPATSSERTARDAAVGKLQEAQARIGQLAYEDAILRLVEATDLLDRIPSVNFSAQQTAIDRVLQEVERRWWNALPACPATPMCRS